MSRKSRSGAADVPIPPAVGATRRAYLGLGSNLGRREQYLAEAVEALVAVGRSAVSPLYETDPVGGPGEQGAYLNLVVELRTDLNARQLLGVGQRLESAAGRVRQKRWGARTLDVDVLWMEGVAIDDDDLVVPHPRLRQRRFVLAPLRDLAPDLVTDAEIADADGFVRCLGPWPPSR